MRTHRIGLTLALAAGLMVGGCGGAAGGGGGPVTSPTGRVYEPGTRPTDSRFTAPATLFLAQGAYDRALEQAQQGIEAQPENARHYFLAGSAYAGLMQFEEADEMWRRAEEIYPAYELEIEPSREEAWLQAFNEGVQLYNDGDIDGALRVWSGANRIYNLRPEAFLNIAIIHTQQNQYDQAIEAYRGGIAATERRPATRVLSEEEVAELDESRLSMIDSLAQLLSFTERHGEAERLYRDILERDPNNVQAQASLAAAVAAQPGRDAEAREMYTNLLSQPGLEAADYFNIGVALFNSEDYARAAQAFGRVAEMQRNSRDAWYNYANALYAGQQYQELIPVATHLVELDPLHENSALLLAQAYRETGQNQQALQALQVSQAAPIHIDEMQMRPGQGQTTIRGRAIGNEAAAGSPVQIRFMFYSNGTQVGTETVTINAPAREQSQQFEVVLRGDQGATGYRYELVR